MDETKFKNLLAFLILMGNEKVLTKTPDYIIEKFERYTRLELDDVTGNDTASWGLDRENNMRFHKYCETWL